MKAVLFSVSIFVGLFSLVSLIFYFGEWNRIIAVALLGLFCGLVAAPEIEPKAFKSAWLWQLLSGAIFGGIFASLFSENPQVVFACVVIFGFAGVTTPYWLKHVQVP